MKIGPRLGSAEATMSAFSRWVWAKQAEISAELTYPLDSELGCLSYESQACSQGLGIDIELRILLPI